MGLGKSVQILEIGSGGPFSDYLKTQGLAIVSTGALDLRYIDTSKLSAYQEYDLILCMEVMEHLKDREDSPVADWAGSGQKNLMKFMYESLKRGGRLFLTTPNVCSYHNIIRLVQCRHPFMYELHVREMSPKDVEVLVHGIGFRMVSLKTEVVWNYHKTRDTDVKEVKYFLENVGLADPHLRGDCIFAIAARP
jgi:SAM-dependent methyltransferase